MEDLCPVSAMWLVPGFFLSQAGIDFMGWQARMTIDSQSFYCSIISSHCYKQQLQSINKIGIRWYPFKKRGALWRQVIKNNSSGSA